jgi:hypothetical protein
MATRLNVKSESPFIASVNHALEPARFRLEIDFLPPSTNKLYVYNPVTKRRFPSLELELFQKRMKDALFAQRVTPLPLGRGSYALSYRINVNRKSDVANREKALTDSLVEAELIPDDRWCDRLTISRDCTIKGVVIEAEAL